MSTKNIQPTPDTEVQRLRKAAQHLADNPLWHEALDTMESEYLELWKRSDPIQTTQRENAYYMVQAIGKLRQQLQTFAQAGTMQRGVAQNNVKG